MADQICVRELGIDCECPWCTGVIPRPGEKGPEEKEEKGEK